MVNTRDASQILVALSEAGELYSPRILKTVGLLERLELVEYLLVIDNDKVRRVIEQRVHNSVETSEYQRIIKILEKIRDNKLQISDILFPKEDMLLETLTQKEINILVSLMYAAGVELDNLTDKNFKDRLLLYKGTKIMLVFKLSEKGKVLVTNSNKDPQTIKHALSVMKKLSC